MNAGKILYLTPILRERSADSSKKVLTGVFALLLILGLTSCSPTPEDRLAELRDAIEDGQECHELFPLFKDVQKLESVAMEAAGEMRHIGCGSRMSERKDKESSELAPEIDIQDVSEECLTAAEKAAATIDLEKADQLIIESLDACTSSAEWLAALAVHPGMMGLRHGYQPVPSDLSVPCDLSPETAVCLDYATITE